MPRKITGAAFLSLDGVMQAPGGPSEDYMDGFEEGGWVFKLWDDEVGETIGSLFAGDYDLLLGRRTYDIFAAYWPYAEGDNKPMSEAFGRAGKHVLTRGNQPLAWQNSHRLSGIDDVARLKQTDGPDLVIQGSSTIYPALLAAGLIDALILMTYPVILGSGKRLFGAGTPVETLEVTDHRVTARGTLITTYRPGGALPPYPPEGPIPATSDREAERQARMKAGTW
ncbi:MAG: dihydrofolate reductase family protein [Erythrobacter sp.]|jgi:dihydrofolate reductase